MDVMLVCLTMFLTPVFSAEFQVQSQDTMVAVEGSDVLLPCTLSPPRNRTGLEVRWFYKLYDTLVFLLRDGLEDRQQQNAEYRGRASLRAGPETGDLALSLLKVRLSDSGKFHCFVENMNSKLYEEAVVQLTVVGPGSPPLITVSLQDNSIRLSCSSSRWFPEPKTHWEKEGETSVQAVDETSRKEANGLFSVDSSILLDDAHKGTFHCRMRQDATGRETSAYVKISEALFPRVSGWLIAFVLLLVVLVSLSVSACWIYHRFKRDKEREQRNLNRMLERQRQEIEWRKISVRKDSVLFDPLTNFLELLISPDRRVISTNVAQDLELNPERFDTEPCTLATPAFSSGTHYWETEIQEREGHFWSLGVARQSVRRTGGQRESPESGIWAIRATADGFYGLSESPVPINPSQRPHIVGTFLNYDSGIVSFYDARTFEHLYSFNNTFVEPVYPFYYVGTGITFVLNPENCA